MSSPPGPNDPTAPRSPGSPAFRAELNTDPGRPHPYESLYRNPVAPQPQRPTPRHFEPALTPPEGNEEATDAYGWLFREAEAASSEGDPDAVGRAAAAAAVPTPVEVPTVTRPAVTPAPAAARPALPTANDPTRRGAPTGAVAADRPRRRRGVVVWIVVLLLVAIGSGIGIAVALRRDTRAPSTSGGPDGGQPSSSSSAAPSTSSTGGAAAVAVTPSKVSASCQAPAATDSDGNKVTYETARMVDGDSQTAWRCDGDGTGETVTFTFPAGTRLGELGLVNGYAKVDGRGAHLYGQYRRITRVTWTFPDGTAFRQELTDKTEGVQTLRIPVLQCDQLTLTIESTTRPGQSARTRDAVLVSEVAFGAGG